jgi:hypothetical protein
MVTGGDPRAVKLTRVVFLLPGGSLIRGDYDGYGGTNQHPMLVADLPVDSQVKVQHQGCYTGESYADAPDSPDEPRQGFMYSEEELERIFSGTPIPDDEPSPMDRALADVLAEGETR